MEPTQPHPVVLTLPEAAAHARMAVTTFKRMFLFTGILKPVDLGARGRAIVFDELNAAIKKRITDQRRDPTIVKRRSAGAQGIGGRRKARL